MRDLHSARRARRGEAPRSGGRETAHILSTAGAIAVLVLVILPTAPAPESRRRVPVVRITPVRPAPPSVPRLREEAPALLCKSECMMWKTRTADVEGVGSSSPEGRR